MALSVPPGVGAVHEVRAARAEYGANDPSATADAVPMILPLERNDERIIAEHDGRGQLVVVDVGAVARQLVGQPQL